MPQYVSDLGLWDPADLAAKEELKQRGVKTLGVKVKSENINNASPNPSYPVMAEAQNELQKVGSDNKFPEIRKRGPGRPKKEK